MLGSVKWFTDVGGYGFIERSDGPDVFVHYTAIVGERRRTLSEGDVVEFEIVQRHTWSPSCQRDGTSKDSSRPQLNAHGAILGPGAN